MSFRVRAAFIVKEKRRREGESIPGIQYYATATTDSNKRIIILCPSAHLALFTY